MKTPIFPILIALALCSCAENSEESGAAESSALADSQVHAAKDSEETFYTRQDVPGSLKDREVAEVTADEIKPPFTAETVTKLNAIVRRSVDTASEYTRSIRLIREAIESVASGSTTPELREEAMAGLAKVQAWHAQALSAQEDMNAATAVLRESGESYSEELLTGMIKYVDDVEADIAAEFTRLSMLMAQE